MKKWIATTIVLLVFMILTFVQLCIITSRYNLVIKDNRFYKQALLKEMIDQKKQITDVQQTTDVIYRMYINKE